MTLADQYYSLLESIRKSAIRSGRSPEEISLIAVSKGHPLEEIIEVYRAGCCDFGESRVQEGIEKMVSAPSQIRWHLIGTLQKNKVHKAVGNFSLIHSVDSFELAKKISETGASLGVEVPVLLQANTSGELTKHGLSPREWETLFPKLLDLPSLNIQGLMTLAPYAGSAAQISSCFAGLRTLRDRLEKSHSGIVLPHLSMGMTNDYEIAIREGATLLRVGRAIFG